MVGVPLQPAGIHPQGVGTFTAPEPGGYAHRTGVFRWVLSEGLWGLIRVRDGGQRRGP